ncbi:NADPH:quinone reductase [Cryobacterium roopkundense]|uniref:NADPH2:quinone reductase n=1 Tax=Cryobacterium roopkundense TaxID=1001240 RepID=A0A099J005_9MICO|nr:NADPH:quinone reductase [Cryobacterium roopkundense]KGJ71744.1 NADPH:quinone reductase [Cryobacterium roopkundense]MBB5641406.1 NADPH2:quinone reductase [Cryobacterium roopkundense]
MNAADPVAQAVIYTRTGGPSVLHVVERPIPTPGAGEVRVSVRVSGVNPTDWKSRQGAAPGLPLAFPEIVPNQDGAGIIDAIGSGVEGLAVGQRVWIWEAAWQRANGTAQQFVVLPASHTVPLPDEASFDLGASLGIPALTAHRCLTISALGSNRLAPGALGGVTVLVAGGAGAVGHAAIQLARWAGATVITTVSSAAKEALVRAAGAHHVVHYRTQDAAASVRALAPNGVDIVVEVAAAENSEWTANVMAPNGVVAIYSDNGGSQVTLPIRAHMVTNTRIQFVLVYTVDPVSKARAVADVSAAVTDGALSVGESGGLPLHRFALDRTDAAHAAVQAAVIGKVLIDIPG